MQWWELLQLRRQRLKKTDRVEDFAHRCNHGNPLEACPVCCFHGRDADECPLCRRNRRVTNGGGGPTVT